MEDEVTREERLLKWGSPPTRPNLFPAADVELGLVLVQLQPHNLTGGAGRFP